MGKGVIWVGLRLRAAGWLRQDDIVLSRGLKGLCEEVGASYSTAKRRKRGLGGGKFEIRGSDGVFWVFFEKEVIRVKGGGAGGFPVGAEKG